jgi:hypothetical protein
VNKIAPNVSLTCRPELRPDRLRLSYAVTNKREEDLYVLDFIPFFPYSDLKSRKTVPDFRVVTLRREGAAGARILKGIPPVPFGRSVNARIIPLGTKLPPGETLERALELALPLREQNPYDPETAETAYREAAVSRLRLTVQVLSSRVEGFEAQPAPPPDFFIVRGKNTVGQAENLDCSLDVPRLPLWLRKDWDGHP